MSDAELLYAFDSGRLREISADDLLVGQLAVADSWLVEDGRARSLREHFSRFQNWVQGVCDRNDLQDFCVAVTSLTPREGRWFPRIELLHNEDSGESQLVFRLRTAPEQIDSMTL